MALPTVAINSSGSNTAASGAGPATALSGSLAATATSTTVNITDVVDLSGVALDGSAALWIASTSGRRWSGISNITGSSGAWVVTVVSAYANTESGKSWAIGGKRATMAGSTRLFSNDLSPGWSVDIQTGETLTAALAIAAGGSITTSLQIRIYSSTTARPLITTATNSINLFNVSGGDCLTFQHLAFSNTAGTKGTYAAGTGMAITPKSSTLNGLTVIDCTFDGFVSALMGDNVVNFSFSRSFIMDSEIKNCTDRGIGLQGTIADVIDHCFIHDNTGPGVQVASGAAERFILTRSVVSGNGGAGIKLPASAGIVVLIGNSITNNVGAALDELGSGYVLVAKDNIITGNGDSGFKFAVAEATSDSGIIPPLMYNNAYFNNTTANITNGPPSFADISLSGSPYVSSTDFGLNTTAGAGALVKGTATVPPNASANTAGDVGAIPSGGGGVGSTGFVARKSINAGGAPSPVMAW